MNANLQTKIGTRALRWLGVAAAAALLSGTAFAQAKGITTTKHNLSAAGGTGSTNKFSGTEQICVFCHTPHGSSADNTHPPLWNRTMPTSNTFTTYDSLGTTTLQGKVLGVGSISLACLSCHDGSQAMNNVTNAGGSGLSNATWTAGTWSGANGTGKPTGAALLSTNLKDDHPVGIEYCGGGITANAGTGVLAGTCNNTEFIDRTAGQTTGDGRSAKLTGGTINSVAAVWVDVDGTADSRGKGDVRLYIRDFTSVGGSANTPSVECGSCHDPHLEASGTNNVAFMRVTPDGSKICLSCHVK